MARPIEATPTLNAEDSERLLADVRNVCSEEEAERRIARADELLKSMLMPGVTP